MREILCSEVWGGTGACDVSARGELLGEDLADDASLVVLEVL